MKRYSDCPLILRDFLSYHENIKAQSPKTISEYHLDLRMFLRFVKLMRGDMPVDTRLEDIDAFTNTADVQDEYAVLDRAGRLQIPKEMLEKIGHSGNRLKVAMQDGKIILEAPEE